MKEIGDNTVRFTALQSGDVDLIERTPYEWVQQIIEGKVKGIGVAKAARAGARNLEFNVVDPPFNNKKLASSDCLRHGQKRNHASGLFRFGRHR